MLSPECVLEPLSTRAVAPFSAGIAKATSVASAQRLARVIGSVMGHAQTGDLPLFAWTLGLPQDRLLQMIATLFPELGQIEPVSAAKYATLLRREPPLFAELVAWLSAQGSSGHAANHVEWMARAVAAAAQGERHLWQDMGLRQRSELSSVLQDYFPALHARNTAALKWKKFLYLSMGADRGIANVHGSRLHPQMMKQTLP